MTISETFPAREYYGSEQATLALVANLIRCPVGFLKLFGKEERYLRSSGQDSGMLGQKEAKVREMSDGRRNNTGATPRIIFLGTQRGYLTPKMMRNRVCF